MSDPDKDVLSFDPAMRTLAGKKGIVLGIANRQSIAYGCAAAFRFLDAELALTYLNEKAKPYVQPIAEELEAPIFLPCDVEKPGQLEGVFEAAEKQWGGIDFALHSIAFARKEDLHGKLLDSSSTGFAQAMDISCHSFVRMARLAAPLMGNGGTLFAMSYYGAEKVVPHYNVMGPVKAALECCVRYLAHELGPRGIRVHAISPGPIPTRAASGINEFDELLSVAETRAPRHQLVSIKDVGIATAALATPAASLITGNTIYVDGGYHIMG
jgi:enoyl-[acyl-carrier protein] reductase I